MRYAYIVVLDPFKNESLLKCFERKVGELPETTVYYSQSRIETSESIYRLLDIKRLNTDSLRGLCLDGVIVCNTLKGSIYKDLSRDFKLCTKRNTILKEIIYI